MFNAEFRRGTNVDQDLSWWGKREIIYLSLHGYTTRVTPTSRWAALIVKSKVIDQNCFLETGEHNRSEVLLLTSLTPYRSAKPAH